MNEQNETLGRIVFKNQPKLSEHEIQRDFNERRLSLIPLIEGFISTHDRFNGKNVSITFLEKGLGSLVSIIETPDEKLILKIPLGKAFSDSEGRFLKVWEQAGVKVPHVIEEGVLGEHSYLLMEYIDAPVLGEAYSYDEFVSREVNIEMGQTLRTMHLPEADGYGRVIDGKAKYKEFKDWLLDPKIQDNIRYVEDNKLLGDENGSLDTALNILLEHVKNKKSSYCHDDFTASNIFSTHPITVFDPNPIFNNGYMDLGRTLLFHIENYGELTEASIQLIQGYFGDEQFDKKVLHASILLNAYIKFPAWHKKKNFKGIQKVQDYLLKNAGILVA